MSDKSIENFVIELFNELDSKEFKPEVAAIYSEKEEPLLYLMITTKKSAVGPKFNSNHTSSKEKERIESEARKILADTTLNYFPDNKSQIAYGIAERNRIESYPDNIVKLVNVAKKGQLNINIQIHSLDTQDIKKVLNHFDEYSSALYLPKKHLNVDAQTKPLNFI